MGFFLSTILMLYSVSKKLRHFRVAIFEAKYLKVYTLAIFLKNFHRIGGSPIRNLYYIDNFGF